MPAIVFRLQHIYILYRVKFTVLSMKRRSHLAAIRNLYVEIYALQIYPLLQRKYIIFPANFIGKNIFRRLSL